MKILAAIALVLAPATAWAGAWSGSCTFVGGNVTGTIGTPQKPEKTQLRVNELGCYRFVAADGTHRAPAIAVLAPVARFSFDPQTDATVDAAGAALVVIRACLAGEALEPASPERSCIATGGAKAGTDALDGVEGKDGTQNAVKRFGTGTYVIDVVGACAAGDTCVVYVQGEE